MVKCEKEIILIIMHNISEQWDRRVPILWKKKFSTTLKTSSSVTANVLSSFPVRLLISFWSSLVSDKIWKESEQC